MKILGILAIFFFASYFGELSPCLSIITVMKLASFNEVFPFRFTVVSLGEVQSDSRISVPLLIARNDWS